MPEIWAGVDIGKEHHHCVVINEDGERLLSRRLGGPFYRRQWSLSRRSVSSSRANFGRVGDGAGLPARQPDPVRPEGHRRRRPRLLRQRIRIVPAAPPRQPRMAQRLSQCETGSPLRPSASSPVRFLFLCPSDGRPACRNRQPHRSKAPARPSASAKSPKPAIATSASAADSAAVPSTPIRSAPGEDLPGRLRC